MTYKEATIYLNNHGYLRNDNEEDCEAMRKAIEALKKQIPKKPYKVGVAEYECPDCHKTLVYKYPCKCGKIIDWESVSM